MEFRTDQFHSIRSAAARCPGEPCGCLNNQQECDPWNQPTSCQRIRGPNVFLGKSPPAYLIRVSRQKEPVQHYNLPLFQRRPDYLPYHFSTRRKEEETLRLRDNLVLRREEDLPDLLSKARPAGFAHNKVRSLTRTEMSRKPGNLGGFPRPFGTLKNDEKAPGRSITWIHRGSGFIRA
jgi:hypothetical protein